jgi:RNA polymerase sigma-70 factor, ECF subfamily
MGYVMVTTSGPPHTQLSIVSEAASGRDSEGEGYSGVHALAPPSVNFARTYAAHFDFVWRSLRHLGVPDPGIDDAVQDVWLVVHRRLADFEGRSSVSTWLFGIAINVARRHRRGRRNQWSAEPLSDKLSERLVSAGPDPERVLVGNDAWRLVHAFLEQLPELPRAIFVCALLENLTPAETAEAVGLDVGTVYKRVRALRRAFQRRLSRNEEGSS